MRIKDLTPYYEGIKDSPLSIGWLSEDDLENSKGNVPYDLINLLKKYEVINLSKGVHMCEYCDKYGKTIDNGNGEIWVVKDDNIYVAPYLIIHYIEKHGYKPPDEFIDAVINGFRPHSMGYEIKMSKFLKK